MNIFDGQDLDRLNGRISRLNHESQPQWGKMNVAQMLAHLNVMFELTYEDTHPMPNAFARFMLRLFVKPGVTNDKPYGKNSRTAPVFLVSDQQDFELQKTRLLDYLKKTNQLGRAHFEQKNYVNFGKMSSQEWNNTFAKHIDHHLTQFGV